MHRIATVAPLVALLVVFFGVAVVAASDTVTAAPASSSEIAAKCAAISRCSECVFDSSNGVLSSALPCSWCEASQSCNMDGTDAAAVCADIRNTTYNAVCPDMSCSAANTSNNIYFCRGPVIAALVFAIFLNIINGFYFLWLKAIWQLPWRFANINAILDDYITRSGSVLASLSAPSASATLTERVTVRTGSSCPICKVQQATPLGPGGVCFWCNIARYGFIPFYAGITGGGLTFLLVFMLPLKPWFSDWYYALLLVIPYVSYTAFVLYMIVYRMTIVGDASQKTTTFFQLAWVLRGRALTTVFPNIAGPQTAASTPRAGAAAAVAATAAPPSVTSFSSASVCAMSEDFIKSKQVETIQLLNMELLSKEVRKCLQRDLATDEFILWWDQPSTSVIAADNKWLVHGLVAGVCIGIWMWVASAVEEGYYPIATLVSQDSLGTIGTIVALGHGALLLITVMGFSRLYIITNKRLVTVAGGILGAHAMSTDINSIKYASIYGYNDWAVGDVLTFTWETPAVVRKMPPIATSSFPGLEDIAGFLEAFRMVAPRLAVTDVIRKATRHNRAVWRMHILLNIGVLAVLPVVVLYSQIAPVGLAFVLLIILGSINVAIIERGLRHQQTTHSPLNLVEAWTSADGEGDSSFDTVPGGPSFLKMLMASKPDIHLPHLQEIAKKHITHLAELTKKKKGGPTEGSGPGETELVATKKESEV